MCTSNDPIHKSLRISMNELFQAIVPGLSHRQRLPPLLFSVAYSNQAVEGNDAHKHRAFDPLIAEKHFTRCPALLRWTPARCDAAALARRTSGRRGIWHKTHPSCGLDVQSLCEHTPSWRSAGSSG